MTVENNKFEHLYLGHTGAGSPIGSAIQVEFPHSFIRKNFISNSSGSIGINVVYPVTAEVEANYVSGSFIDAQLTTYMNSASQDRADSLLISNNVLIGSSQSGTLQVYTRNSEIFHNTIVHNGSNTIAFHVYGSNCSVINNILLAYGGWLAYEQLEADNLISDHNLFYSTCTKFARSHQGIYYETLESYQAATGLDLNSHFSDITFDFDSLGIHLDECQAQNNALDGVPLPEVPFDYYDARRDSVRPFVGAVEGVRLPYDMFGAPFRTALTGFPLSVASGNFDNSSGPGIAVPDWDNSQVLLFHNNGATRSFTQTGTINTNFRPTIVKLFDLDEDNNLDLIVGGDTNAVEIFWGNGSSIFSSSDIVETFGRVRSLEGGPRFTDFSTIVTTEDNGFLPSTSFIGYIMNSTGRQLCYDVQRSGLNNDVDTINAVLTDFVLSDLGNGWELPAIVAPGLVGSSNVVPELFFSNIQALIGWVLCQTTNTLFSSVDNDFQFPVTGNYTNSSSIVTGDFDGDLDNDFITTGWDDNYCVFVRNNGSFTFTADTIFTAATRGLAALDYENDGDLDFVTINNTLDIRGITVFLNDGIGNFEEKRNCFFPFASGHPNGITAADFDQDGNADIAIVSRTPFGGDSLFVLYNLGGFNQTTDVETPPPVDEIPETFELSQNYPNPFNPTTTIQYSIPQAGNINLKIYNLLGEEVKTLVDEYQEAGKHSVHFNAKSLASGIYFYKLQADRFTSVKKMILIK